MALLRAVLLLLALAGPAAAAEVTARGHDIGLEARPVTIAPGEFGRGVDLLGAWQLVSGDAGFGGLSGLLVENGRMTAIGDRGAWVTATLDPEDPRLVRGARLAPMLSASGRPLEGLDADAEGLARSGGDLYVAFEHRHRLMRHVGEGRLAEAARPSAWAGLGDNEGLEALATLPDGTLLAIAEGRAGDGFPLWLLRPRGSLRAGRLPAVSKHAVTGADIGPDERLYVLQRHFSPLEGVSMRLLSYALGADGMPDPGRMTRLAGFDSVSGIDNMEGVSVERGPDGRLRAWVLADDNFNGPQRTILLLLGLPG